MRRGSGTVMCATATWWGMAEKLHHERCQELILDKREQILLVQCGRSALSTPQ